MSDTVTIIFNIWQAYAIYWGIKKKEKRLEREKFLEEQEKMKAAGLDPSSLPDPYKEPIIKTGSGSVLTMEDIEPLADNINNLLLAVTCFSFSPSYFNAVLALYIVLEPHIPTLLDIVLPTPSSGTASPEVSEEDKAKVMASLQNWLKSKRKLS